ncbi:MAG: cell division protein SepF, partial [Candidatus Aenigmarchaeota archaeon]|nr:cell division protein SepF [Candidatus Aenigmarchaeota archaeon]
GLLREGYIVFVSIKDLKDRDLSELKRAIDKLKRTVLALNGDIVGVEEDFIVLTPGYAKIAR